MCGKDPFCFLNKFLSYGIYRPCSSLANVEVRRFPVESGKGTFQSLVEIVSISESCLQAVRRCKKSSVCSTGLWKMNQCQMMRCFGMYFFSFFFSLVFFLRVLKEEWFATLKGDKTLDANRHFPFSNVKITCWAFYWRWCLGLLLLMEELLHHVGCI